jgi:ABC-type molybdate transport system substrate-binding protein
MKVKSNNNKAIISLGIIGASLVLAFAPIPGVKQSVAIVSGTELKEPLQELETKFEADNPSIDLQLEFQGSQDMVDNYIDQKNDFQANILIPANGEILQELDSRWQAQSKNNSETFTQQPTAIAKTLLVGIAWQERGEILFPDDRFSWSKIEQAIKQKNWSAIGNKPEWGSFDFITTDPTRSNSGQLTLNLWVQAENYSLTSFDAKSLVSLIKQSIYQPPRSTDILLQEFITRGANDGDVAMVYESIALYRWSQAKTTQGQPYRIYYPDPTAETFATAAVMNQNTPKNLAKAANKFIAYLTQPEQQKVFVKYGFRPTISGIDLLLMPDSPWSQNIPGVMPNLSVKTQQPPNSQEISEIQQLWDK